MGSTITFCAGGRLSINAAKLLTIQGYDAYSLEGGMKAWNYAYDTAEIKFENFKIIQVRRVAKGCLSYIVGSGNSAIVIDASLHPEIYESIAKNEGWKIDFVTDTHIHADYVSRTLELSKYTNATLLLNSESKVEFSFNSLKNNEKIRVGNIHLIVLHTPGHTSESTSFEIENKVLLTGDTLFTNSIGRPDLTSDEAETKRKAHSLYKSLQLLLSYNDDIFILPAHTSTSIEIGQPIIAEKLKSLKENTPILEVVSDVFIETILNRLPPTPPNYLIISEINKTGEVGKYIIADLESGANRCAIS